MNKKYLKDLGILLGIVIVASIGARVLAGGETLDKYAERNGLSSKEASTPVAEDTVSASSTHSTAVADDANASDYLDQSSRSSDIASASETSSENTAASYATDAEISVSQDAASTEISAPQDAGAVKISASQVAAAGEVSDPQVAAAGEINDSPDRVTLQEGFYYEPISNEIFRRISGISYPVDCTVALDDLRYVGLMYVDFDGKAQNGEMICNKSIAQDIVEIFSELYNSGYQIENIKLIDEYNGDDTASMEANNTSCFNYRVVDGTTRLSNHAYGLAIDLNPYYNPYITYNKDGTTNCSPQGSRTYEDRSAAFPYKIDENDLAYKLFKEHGFKWGGNWNSVKDYQHFEKKG